MRHFDVFVSAEVARDLISVVELGRRVSAPDWNLPEVVGGMAYTYLRPNSGPSVVANVHLHEAGLYRVHVKCRGEWPAELQAITGGAIEGRYDW